MTSGATRVRDKAKAWLEQAIDSGADVIAACRPFRTTRLRFSIWYSVSAEKHGLPLDLHIDEHLDSKNALFEPLAERTEALGLQGRVVASHSSALSALDRAEAGRIIEKLARARIAIVTLPAANLFLQGRDAAALPPRGLTRIVELLVAGVPVAAGSDNIQDLLSPPGRGICSKSRVGRCWPGTSAWVI